MAFHFYELKSPLQNGFNRPVVREELYIGGIGFKMTQRQITDSNTGRKFPFSKERKTRAVRMEPLKGKSQITIDAGTTEWPHSSVTVFIY